MAWTNPFAKLLNKVEAFARNIDTIIVSKVIKNDYQLREEIIDLNRYGQLYDQGIRSNGKYLPEYKEATKQEKRIKNQKTGNMTLSDTWEFYHRFRLDWRPGSFSITSDAAVTPKLVKKYGKSIFGLTEENKAKVAGIVYSHLKGQFTSYIKNPF